MTRRLARVERADGTRCDATFALRVRDLHDRDGQTRETAHDFRTEDGEPLTLNPGDSISWTSRKTTA